ncbi:MAG: hypothetical protein VYC39_04535 [Myxococcota bacterium]|nr:hypothetical protein [Myxococcota bacterium]
MKNTRLFIAFVTVACLTDAKSSLASDGVMKGRVIFTGSADKPSKITPTTDTSICGLQDLVDESLVVDTKTKGLSSAVIWIAGSKRKKKSEKESVLLDNYRCRYEPHVLVLHTDQKLKIRNKDRFLHTTQALLGKKSKFNVALPTKNQTVKKRFSKPGFYSIHCDVHDWMKAWVAVFKNEIAAVTSPTGEFSLEGLPVGKQKLELWHEKLGRKTVDVVITKSGTKSFEIKW